MGDFLSKSLSFLASKARTELFKGSAWALFLRGLGLLASYLLLFSISYLYDASVLGMFTLTLTILQILSILARSGLDIGLLRIISGKISSGQWNSAKLAYKKGILFSLLLSTLLALSLFFFAAPIAEKWMGIPRLTPYLKYGSVAIIALSFMFINGESLRALKKVKHYVFLKQVGVHSLSLLLLWGGYLFCCKSLNLPIFAYVLSTILLGLIGFLWWNRASHYKRTQENMEGQFPSLREMLKISIPMLLASSLFMIINWTDTLMLGFFATEEEVGIYSVAYRIANVSNLTLFAVNSIAVPKISAFYSQGNMAQLKRTVKHSTFMIFWSTMPLVLVIVIFPNFLLGLFGEEFQQGMVALLLIMTGKFISALSGCVGQILQMTDHQKLFQNIVLLSCLINILLNYYLIPLWGIQGAAIASMVSIGFWNLTAMAFIKAKLGFFTIQFLPLKN